MTYPDRDGAWRPPSARRPEDETPQPPAPPQRPAGPAQPYPGQPYPGQPQPGQVYRAQQQPGGAAGYPPVAPPPGAVYQAGAAQQGGGYQAGAVPQAAAGPQGVAQPAPLPPPPMLARRRAAEAPPPVVGRTAVPAEPVSADAGTSAGTAARRLAAPAVTAAPLAAPAALAAAGSLVDGPQDGGPPADEALAEARTGPSGRMSRLHVGWHTISRAALSRVAVAPAASAGLIIGRDRQHAAVPLRLFAPEPVRATLVGGVWVAQLLIFRAFSLGARVTVVTNEPRAWAGFGERATGQYNRLTVLSSDQGLVGTGTAQRPMLTLYDYGTTGPATAPPLGPWRTQLTMLRQLDRAGVAALQDAQFTLLQRLGSAEATLAASALRLRPHSSQFLQFMADDMIALVEEGTDRYVFLAETGVEQQQVGTPRR